MCEFGSSALSRLAMWDFPLPGGSESSQPQSRNPVAVLGKTDRRISNISHFFQEKQRNKHRLRVINSQCDTCLINRYNLDNSRRITLCNLCGSPGNRKNSKFTLPLLLLIFPHSSCCSGFNLASVNETPPCCTTVFTCFMKEKSCAPQRQSCGLGFLDTTSSGSSSSRVLGRQSQMFGLSLLKYLYLI